MHVDVVPRRREPVHDRPFCHRRTMDAGARGDGNAGVLNDGMREQMVDPSRHGMDDFKAIFYQDC